MRLKVVILQIALVLGILIWRIMMSWMDVKGFTQELDNIGRGCSDGPSLDETTTCWGSAGEAKQIERRVDRRSELQIKCLVEITALLRFRDNPILKGIWIRWLESKISIYVLRSVKRVSGLARDVLCGAWNSGVSRRVDSTTRRRTASRLLRQN